MEYLIENALLQARISSRGAELVSLVCKADGVEHIWQGDPAVWKYHAPILFPWCGKQVGGSFTAKGKRYEAPQHGFGRNLEHRLVSRSDTELVLALESSPETLARWPYAFRLVSSYRLEGDRLHHCLRVENPGEETLRFGIGYHPGFALPFDEKHSYADYELRFDREESPLCLSTPAGLVTDKTYKLGKCMDRVALTEHLFDNDSYCMTGLHSSTLGLYEKDSGRAVVCEISGFPYCLIWSAPGRPQYVCIEPWHSLPSFADDGDAWEQRACAARLSPGEHWETCLTMRFKR